LPYRTSQAIVLQRADWRENDRVLTLLSPQWGRADALCRGCRKPKSPLLAASERLTLGEYVLFSGKGRDIVHAASVTESYYPLRLDYGRLEHAALMAAAALKAAQPEEPAPHLFLLLARSLSRLAYGALPPRAVTCAYLLHFASVIGFMPVLDRCVRCGKAMGEEAGFLLVPDGGVACAACAGQAPERLRLSAKELSWLRRVLAQGVDKAGEPPARVPAGLLRQYAEDKLEAPLPRLPADETHP